MDRGTWKAPQGHKESDTTKHLIHTQERIKNSKTSQVNRIKNKEQFLQSKSERLKWQNIKTLEH